SRLTLSAPGTAVAGTAVPATVSIWDPYGNLSTGFTGTVHFTSTDPIADLPADFAFGPGDQGTHTFQVTFERAGTQSLSVASTGLAADQQTGIQVPPTVGDHFAFVQGPLNTFARTPAPVPVAVQLEDRYGNSVAQSVPVNLSLGANPTGARL